MQQARRWCKTAKDGLVAFKVVKHRPGMDRLPTDGLEGDIYSC